MLSRDDILQNRYRIHRELGRGGMGTVYEAFDQNTERPVAIKEMSATNDAKARQAFKREATLLANLRHPNLPQVLDHFSENGGNFLVMQLIPGLDLAELLDFRAAAFPKSQVLKWANDLLGALEYLHGHNPPILHRDIKPSNLKQTVEGHIFLLDFGLAQGATGQMSTLTSDHRVALGCTPAYAPFEQQMPGQEVDPRADLYSLGATLYHLIGGTVPVDACSRYTTFAEEKRDPLQPLDGLGSPKVAAVVYKAMAVLRKDRFTTAAEMRQALSSAAVEDERDSRWEEYRLAEERRREREAQKQAEAEQLIVDGQAKVAEVQDALEAETQRFPINAAERIAKNEESAPSDHDSGEASVSREAEPDVKLVLEAERGIRQVTAKIVILIILAVAIVSLIIGVYRRSRVEDSSVQDPSVNKPSTSVTREANAIGGGNAEPLPAPPTGMIVVPGGIFIMGRNDGDDFDKPAHVVTIKAFFIDVYEVTCEDYQKFMDAFPERPAPSAWNNRKYPPDWRRRPVVGVTWADAKAYAQWLGKDLPTEEQWEFAARGDDERLYPWGKEWRKGLANADGAATGVVDVGSFPEGRSPFGALDMAGNAWEWTDSTLSAYPGGKLKHKPSPTDKVIRGGSFFENSGQVIVTYRGYLGSQSRNNGNTGFRCVKNLGSPVGGDATK